MSLACRPTLRIERRPDAVVEPRIEDVLVTVGDIESPELIDVAQPRHHVRRRRGRDGSERNAVELGQWSRQKVASAATAVLVRNPKRAILQRPVDIAESNLVFPRLITVAILAMKILALVRCLPDCWSDWRGIRP